MVSNDWNWLLIYPDVLYLSCLGRSGQSIIGSVPIDGGESAFPLSLGSIGIQGIHQGLPTQHLPSLQWAHCQRCLSTRMGHNENSSQWNTSQSSTGKACWFPCDGFWNWIELVSNQISIEILHILQIVLHEVAGMIRF